MAKKKEEPAPVTLPADAACAVYKDRAGSKLGGGPTEGKVNFAAVTAEALKVLTPAAPPAPESTEE